jgi:hypothetical protein
MMPASFSSLPPELLCRVFESADDFSVVAALARTAHIFYDIWRANPTVIYDAVAPRVFSNVAELKRLADMQEEAEASKQPQSRQKGYEKTISHVKRLLFNARCASAACDIWVSLCEIHHYPDRGENPYMTSSERDRFEQEFYRVWTVGVMAKAPHLQKQASAYLSSCSPRELYRLDEMATWLRYYTKNDFGSLGLDLHDETWKAGYELIFKRWTAYQDSGIHSITIPDFTPSAFFAFFDNTQDYLCQIPGH